MCTLTWDRSVLGDLEVWFNRDEKKARPIAEPPTLRKLAGTRFLSPRDSQGGGTWMLVNEFGLVVCLLNKWQLGTTTATGVRKSRGQLVWAMGAARTIEEVGSRLQELENYPAFVIVALNGDEERAWDWNGRELTQVEPKQPFTSSSYCFLAVKKKREAVFKKGLASQDYHSSIGEVPSAFTVRMNRPDAQTWSRSRVRVSKETSGYSIEWEYLAEEPDLTSDPERFLHTLTS